MINNKKLSTERGIPLATDSRTVTIGGGSCQRISVYSAHGARVGVYFYITVVGNRYMTVNINQ